MVVLAIIIVIATIAFIAVFAYLRSMTKLEYDGYAKEIFIAAQNHLATAESQGYLLRTDAGTEEVKMRAVTDTGDGVYVFVVTGDDRESLSSDKSLLGLMLPYASIDETIRDGCFLIRYHKDSAQVLDVFYWSETGRYSHKYVDSDYMTFLANRENRDALRTYVDDSSVIGYYGGVTAQGLTKGEELKTPSIVVENGNTLNVKLTDPNASNTKAKWKLIITGLTSGNSAVVSLTDHGIVPVTDLGTDASGNKVYDILLDDITNPGTHFYDLFCVGSKALIPGEDISVQAYAYNDEELTNVAYSASQKTNSLFAYNSEGGYAAISNIRHLENLDENISRVDSTNANLNYVEAKGAASYTLKAEQTTDLAWDGFTSGKITGAGTTISMTSEDGTFHPVTPQGYELDYNGRSMSISGLTVKESTGNAGVFGTLNGANVSNLLLSDITSEGVNAGTLAGASASSRFTNVMAVNESMTPTVTGTDCAGGLVGSAVGGSFHKSAAAVVVSGTNAAGGLVGSVSNASVSGCYSAAHTVSGTYDTSSADKYNVVSEKNAGGLAGIVKDTTVTSSYSTCSASGTTAGGTAGGFAGLMQNSTVSNSYATGTVYGATASGAFAGTADNGCTATACGYFELMNERASDAGEVTYLKATGTGDLSGASAFDDDLVEYKTFTVPESGNERISASPYDSTLTLYDRGNYPMPGVKALGADVNDSDFVSAHRGDWPIPDTFVVNEPAS